MRSLARSVWPEPPLVRSSPTVCDSPAPASSVLAVHARGWPVRSRLSGVPHCAIGGVVDVGLYHGGVHPQFAAADYLLSLGLSDDALMQLLHHRGAQQQSQLADGLGVRRLVHPNARELAIDQIGAHFPRQYAIAP